MAIPKSKLRTWISSPERASCLKTQSPILRSPPLPTRAFSPVCIRRCTRCGIRAVSFFNRRIRPWRRFCSSRDGKRRRLSDLRCSKSSSGSTRDSRSTTTRCQEPIHAKVPGNMPSGGWVRSTGLSRGLARSRENLSCSGRMCLIHTLPMIRRLPFGKNTADGSTTEKWLTPTMNWVGCSRLSPGSRRHGIR